MDKGQTLIRKLGKKVKSEDKKDVKLEKMTEPSKEDYEPWELSADSKGKGFLLIKKEDQPVKNRAPVEALMNEKTVVT